ncbi:MAG TPA: hypothetical protein VFM88_10740 [Vicinamibacteria bacterium]|nr:hypothetical protein [Vicinamibacteria bacterium]
MPGWTILTLLAVTTAAAYWVGSRRLGLAARRLPEAAGRALETLGAAFVFFAVNFGLCVMLALGVRSYTDGFLSLHQLSDWIVLVLSLLQALMFQAWRDTKPARS